MARLYTMNMPQGMTNFALAALILNLKMLLLPRLAWMPGMICYISASAVETALYLLGWPAAGWSAAVSLLAVLAAVESTEWALGVQSNAERSSVRGWCWGLGLMFGTIGLIADGTIYPHYSNAVYNLRLESSLFSSGYLVALLGYAFANNVGVKKYVIHASILLLRVATFGALLLVHDRALWFTADLIGEVVNILTLGAWLWLLSARRLSVKAAV